jgi:hypothetical protein
MHIFTAYYVLVFLLQKGCNERCFLFSFSSKNIVIWLEGLSDLSNNFDSPIRWTVRVMYIYYWRGTAKYEAAKSEGWLYYEVCGLNLYYVRRWPVNVMTEMYKGRSSQEYF